MTPFAKKVYRVVLSIPLGEVRTYKWVARKSGKPRSYRAVGMILKNNPYPLIIPCHRVIKSNNIAGGYIFGEKKKKTILRIERALKECLANRR